MSYGILRVFSTLLLTSYSLGEKIGEGTFSTVFLARRKAGCREVTLKHLIPTSKPHRSVVPPSPALMQDRDGGALHAGGGRPLDYRCTSSCRADGRVATSTKGVYETQLALRHEEQAVRSGGLRVWPSKRTGGAPWQARGAVR